MTFLRAARFANPEAYLPWACVAAVTAWFTALALRVPPADGDLLWQRWLGERILREHDIPRSLGAETFAAQGAPWTPHEWLFSSALAALDARGAAWIAAVACTLAFALALVTVVVRCRRRGVSPGLTSAAVLACGFASMQSFGVRAQVLGWACLSTVVMLLETEGPLAWAAVPVTVLWANLHASAFLSPAVAALFTVSALLRDRRWSPAVMRSSALAGACGLATLATPLGVDLARYALALATSPIRHSISEWGATSADSAAFLTGALPLLLVLAAFGVRASVRDRLLAATFTLVLFAAVRNVPIFALVSAPIALAALPARRLAGAAAPGVRAAAWMTLLAVAGGGAAIATLTWQRAPAAAAGLPLGPARVLLADARHTPRIFCEDFAWCSLFLDARARFYMDGRCDPYPAPVWRDYRAVMDGHRGWASILDREQIDAVLVRRDGVLDSLLAERHGAWLRIASDSIAGLYVRPALLGSVSPSGTVVAADARGRRSASPISSR